MREGRAADEGAILDLFRRVFRVERSSAHWRWKFLGNPAGREVLVAVDREGRVVGQFASLPNRGRIDGEERLLSQLLDHMVEPGLHRRGVYAALARAFHQRFVARDPAAAYFGFNLEEIYRIESRLYGMELVHQVGALRCDLARIAPQRGLALAFAGTLVRVERVTRFPDEVDALWEAGRERYAAAIARDARYLNWRYADCPDVEYVLALARHRLSGRPLGLAVLRPGWIHEPIAALVDWVVPGARPAVWLGLLDLCHDAARSAGLAVARAWLPPTSPDRAVLQSLGYVPEATPFLVSLWNDGRPERPLAALARGWHYTMGDTDIF